MLSLSTWTNCIIILFPATFTNDCESILANPKVFKVMLWIYATFPAGTVYKSDEPVFWKVAFINLVSSGLSPFKIPLQFVTGVVEPPIFVMSCEIVPVTSAV